VKAGKTIAYKALVKPFQNAPARNRKCGPFVIGFGAYHYKYESGREGDTPLVAFSPRKAATVFYNVTGFPGADPLLAKLGKHTTGNACLIIKKLTDVDQTVLKDLFTLAAAAVRARYPD